MVSTFYTIFTLQMKSHFGTFNDDLINENNWYSHLSNNRWGWNKRGGGAKVAKSIIVEVGINVEGGIFWKKLVYKCNKRGVEGGKNLRNQ